MTLMTKVAGDNQKKPSASASKYLQTPMASFDYLIQPWSFEGYYPYLVRYSKEWPLIPEMVDNGKYRIAADGNGNF